MPSCNRITTSGLLTIGATGHTGPINIGGVTAIDPGTATGGLTIVNNTGDISIGQSITSPAALTITANGGGLASGAITMSGGTLTASSGNMSLNAATGIGSISGSHPVVVALPSGYNFSATNLSSGTTLGDLYVQTTGAASIGTAARAFSQNTNNGALRVDVGGTTQNLTIGGSLSVNGAGSITLQASGAIIYSSGTLTTPSLYLTAQGGAIGSFATPVPTNATTLLSASATSDIYLSNTGNVR